MNSRARAYAVLIALAMLGHAGCQSAPTEDPYFGHQQVGTAGVTMVADGEAGDGEVGFSANLHNVVNAPIYAIECVLVENPNDAEFLDLVVLESGGTYFVDDDGDGKLGPGENNSLHDGPDKTSIRSIHRTGNRIMENGTCRVDGLLRLPKNESLYRVQITVSYGPPGWR